MTDDDGGAENAAVPRVDPRIDNIELVLTDDEIRDQITIDAEPSHSIEHPTHDHAVHRLAHNQGDRGHAPPSTSDDDGGDGEDETLERVARHAGADRLTVVRLPGVRRINAYYLETAPGDLAETVRRLDRQTTADAIATVGLGGHAIVRLTYYREDEATADTGEELLYPTGDDDLNRLVVDGEDGGES